MKRIVRYTSYEGNSTDQVFIGVDADSLDKQEFELDEHYYRCYGVGGFTKETIKDESFTIMKNIFENAFFGKAYKTRDEWKAIYVDCEDKDFNSHPHRLLVEGTKMFVFYNDFGTAMSSSDDDIVSEWHEIKE